MVVIQATTLLLAWLNLFIPGCYSFLARETPLRWGHQATCCDKSILFSTEVDSTDGESNSGSSDNLFQQKESLKTTLLQLGASYDRGFGASPSARREVDRVIADLEALGARGTEESNLLVELEGIWRMVWTTAQDVLVLAASPVATVGAIYQVFEPPIVTNIIDFFA